MITIDVPGYKTLNIHNVVFDFNGTIAKDGVLVDGVIEIIKDLANKGVKVYVLTADTNGSVKRECSGLPVYIEKFDKGNAILEKRKVVERLGSDITASFGNGRNDSEMFKISTLSIGVIGSEGCFSKTIFESDIVVTNIIDGINLLLKPNRLKATLRN
ncbi:HAD family hydrolase [Anaerosalibacter sp. Marseille-P3206]|uniref:HAD family hydrolase n=1 Tax=Anaerosalibacter sp. Marseille-P3206 TaxID=1871005 RepID=UPI000987ABCA|nr:HAD family hydrolase [Anaerosalibacter sp. Marseille-P3206]